MTEAARRRSAVSEATRSLLASVTTRTADVSARRSDASPPPIWPEVLDAAAIPTADAIFGWIEEVFARGIRRPGYPADEWAIEYIAETFRELGLENVRREPIPAVRWEPTEWSLEVTAAGETRTLDCYPFGFAPSVENLEVELVAWDDANRSAVSGNAALFDNTLIRLPATVFAVSGSVPNDLSGRVIDSDGSLDGAEHVIPLGPAGQEVVEPFAANGAVAVVGALIDYPGDSCEYYVPYTGLDYPIPGVWIRGRDGARLFDQLDEGPVQIRMTVRATRADVESANVIGELAGADDDVVIIGSHHDGPWSSAVEDGSGIALVIAQAAFWAAQPVERRPHRLQFLLHGGHMSGGSGIAAYLAAHAQDLERCVLEIHLEHACREFVEVNDRVVPTGRCTPRWWFTSPIPRLERAVVDALTAECLGRSMLVAPDAIGDHPPTDGSGFFQAGVPAVSFLSAPFYLFDSIDTLDKVDRENLVPLTRSAARIVHSTAGTSPGEMRSRLEPVPCDGR